MTKIPDNADSRGSSRPEHRQNAGPVIFARFRLDEVPAKPVPRASHPVPDGEVIVALAVDVMTGCPNHVQTGSIPPPMSRAFKPCEKIAAKLTVEHGGGQTNTALLVSKAWDVAPSRSGCLENAILSALFLIEGLWRGRGSCNKFAGIGRNRVAPPYVSWWTIPNALGLTRSQSN